MEYEYKGTKIALNAAGEFVAEINGKIERAPSLSAIKKRLDKKEQFEPFAAISRDSFIRWAAHKKPFYEMQIVGIAKARGKRSSRNKDKFLTSAGQEIDSVFEDTPEARALLTQWCEEEKRHSEELEALEKKHNECIEQILSQLVVRDCPQSA